MIKKWICFLLTIVFVFLYSIPAQPLAGAPMDPPPAKPKKDYIVIVLQINNPLMRVDQKIVEIDPGRDTVPIISNGSTLCPIRAIIEAIGGSIAWDGSEQKTTLTLKTLKLELWINKKTAKVNGVSKNLSIAPQIINGRTMLPLRFVSEELGCNVLWDATDKIITIEYSLKGKTPSDEKPPVCTVDILFSDIVHLSNKEEEDSTKLERWSVVLTAQVSNAPKGVVLGYAWKIGDTALWGAKSKDPKVTANLVFSVSPLKWLNEKRPVDMRVLDWSTNKILATKSIIITHLQIAAIPPKP
jgi:hypothetical protein